MRRFVELTMVLALALLFGKPTAASDDDTASYVVKMRVRQGTEEKAKSLAEPTLVVRDDCEASFMSGTEDPGEERLLAGTKLKMTVAGLEDGRIKVRCHVDLAETDFSGSVEGSLEVSRRLSARFLRSVAAGEQIRVNLTKAGDVWLEMTIDRKVNPAAAESVAKETAERR